MSPRRNIGEQPTRPRHIARVGSAVGPAQPAGETLSFAHLMSTGAVRRAVRAFAPALALAVSGLTVACADGPTAPGAPRAAAAPSLAAGSTSTSTTSSPTSSILSQTQVGDTVVTRFVVGTSSQTAATFNIGNMSKIDFPYAAGSICDLGTSSYGHAYWNATCTASKTSVTITAKTWKNAQGKVASDFQPAMRFVPGLRMPVKLTLRDAALAGTGVLYCNYENEVCVDEAAADPSLAPTLDPKNGFVYRSLKHFSGYTVVAN